MSKCTAQMEDAHWFSHLSIMNYQFTKKINCIELLAGLFHTESYAVEGRVLHYLI